MTRKYCRNRCWSLARCFKPDGTWNWALVKWTEHNTEEVVGFHLFRFTALAHLSFCSVYDGNQWKLRVLSLAGLLGQPYATASRRRHSTTVISKIFRRQKIFPQCRTQKCTDGIWMWNLTNPDTSTFRKFLAYTEQQMAKSKSDGDWCNKKKLEWSIKI